MPVVPVLRAERKQTAPVLVPAGYFSSSGEPSMTIKPVLFLVGAALGMPTRDSHGRGIYETAGH